MSGEGNNNKRHKWVETEGIDNKDIIGFYNHYLKKFDKTGVTTESLSLGRNDTASLMVIDMQNDFILEPPGLGHPPGRFSVANGLSMAPKLKKFIEDNATKFHKIIFTRDTHPINHCSFITMGGPFPPHCVINHGGAALHPDMLALKDLPNADVIFKGCKPTADSFGAYEYKDKAYLERRQLGDCCRGGLCSKDTGGFHLKDASRKWNDYPFTGITEYENTDDAVLLPAAYPDATYENIKDQIGKPFELGDIIPAKRESGSTHTIFICGLAGDYCVKDTAMNLAKDIKESGLENIRIVILQPFTRYAFLPLQYVGGYQVYKNTILTNTASGVFSNISNPKDINHYLFTIGMDGSYKLLTKQEAQNAASNIGKIKQPNNSTNPKLYAAFLTPIKDILDDYSLLGIKILMDDPKLSSMVSVAGGRRRHSRVTHKVKRHHKSKRTFKSKTRK
jgi:nicotinamidase-related amidase